jgi:putative hydrolase of the HAD superfamily
MQLNGCNNPKECIMIGDSYEADIVGAQNAEIDQVYYPLNADAENKKATYRIKSLRELREIV